MPQVYESYSIGVQIEFHKLLTIENESVDGFDEIRAEIAYAYVPKLSNVTDGVEIQFRQGQDEESRRSRETQLIGMAFEKGQRGLAKELFLAFDQLMLSSRARRRRDKIALATHCRAWMHAMHKRIDSIRTLSSRTSKTCLLLTRFETGRRKAMHSMLPLPALFVIELQGNGENTHASSASRSKRGRAKNSIHRLFEMKDVMNMRNSVFHHLLSQKHTVLRRTSLTNPRVLPASFIMLSRISMYAERASLTRHHPKFNSSLTTIPPWYFTRIITA